MLAKILQIAKMHYKETAIYKANFFLYTFNHIIEVIVYIAVWQAIYIQSGSMLDFTGIQMITYYVLVVTLRPIITDGINADMGHAIRSGEVAGQLLNPISYFKYYFGYYLGEISFAFVISIATFIICSFCWPLQMPVSFFNILISFVIIILSIPIMYFIQMIVGITGFYTSSIWGMQILRRSIISIFSGAIAPIMLFPQWFQTIASLLPFQELCYTPINLYLGKIGLENIPLILLKQGIWIILLYIIAKLFFEHAIKKVTINGG